ncbi:outer membrane protein assembly factor BamE [Novispirillum sp. DQ9]|uniref:outer membrane protein assembly factor BamE n=1 Tax=Novispirillum sp. DQ9 TaxID=3398612 RepID=UPI003C7AD743
MTLKLSLRGLFPALAVLAPLALTLPACTPEVTPRGNLPSPSVLAQVVPGETSRPQVASLLGTPSSTSLFDNGEVWYYIGARTTQYAVYSTDEVERSIVAVRFDPAGRVEKVTTLGKEDGEDVTLVGRSTPTAGNELNFLQQMLGNVGRFNKDTGN